MFSFRVFENKRRTEGGNYLEMRAGTKRHREKKLRCKGQEATETINSHKVQRTHRAKDEVMVPPGWK